MGVGRAVKRPVAPSPRPSSRPVVPVVRQRDLPTDDPLRAALHMLGLKAVPGSVEALHELVGLAGGANRATRGSWADLKAMGLLEVEAISYIRGRSIPRQFMIVDEAQNLTPHEVKTIVTRVGEGTKIVLTGDPYQIDNPYVYAESNGLTWLVERFKGQRLAGHVSLLRGERSALAELAASLL